MMETTDPALQHLPVALRNLQQSSLQGLNHHSDSIASQLGHAFDPSDPNSYQGYSAIGSAGVNGNQLQSNNVFNVQSHNAQPSDLQSGNDASTTRTPLRQSTSTNNYSHAQYNLITPEQQLPTQAEQNSIARLRQESAFLGSPTQDGGVEGGHFGGMKLVENPPNLQEWREKLFSVDEVITLTEQEFQTYFPHVDNVYSHRSTQKYKRKPFVSHYWDCRLKGRPPGTPKSNDPAKKKRKRTARERDLCDVKIKITEYFPGAGATMSASDFGSGVDGLPVDLGVATSFFAADTQNAIDGNGGNEVQPFGVLAPSANLPVGHPGAGGAKYYTIQRVNNNPTGKGDTPGGPHKHTLEDSDRIKKNSVQRWLLKQAKEKKKDQQQQQQQQDQGPQLQHQITPPLTRSQPTRRPLGLAAQTAKRHCKEADLKLFGTFTCPFVQRIWIALEVKGLSYQYIEVDIQKKPDSLMQASPKGMIPAIMHGNWGTFESMIIMEYLEDLAMGHTLLPLGDPQLRAHSRQWADHINRYIIPAFYALLTCDDPAQHASLTSTLQDHITALVNSSHVTGPFFLGPQISYVDVIFAPWILRLSRVLKYFRGWPDPEVGSRWETWVAAVEDDERVKSTVSEESMYRERYQSIVENRPGASNLWEMKIVGPDLWQGDRDPASSETF